MTTGTGRDSEFEMLILCENWLDNLDKTLVRSKQDHFNICPVQTEYITHRFCTEGGYFILKNEMLLSRRQCDPVEKVNSITHVW